MELFRLKTLRVRDNNIFKSNIEFNFSQESDTLSLEAPYFTLVIGPNGTGKSNLLKLVIDIFRLAYEKKTSLDISYYPSGKYSLEYFLTDGNYTILNSLGWEQGEEKPLGIEDKKDEKGIRFFKNGVEISVEELIIPESIIALSIMLTDKYPVLRDPSKFPIYNYLGIRKDSNTAGTKTYIYRTIDYVFEASSRKSFLDDVKEMLKFLELDEQFYVSYSPRYKHLFFTGNITQDFFEDFFADYKKYLHRESEPWNIKVFKALKETEPEIIPQIVELLNYLSTKLENIYEGSRSKYFEFDIFHTERNVIEIFRLLPYLNKLDLISYPTIMLSKFGKYYSVEESSSGEYHFISTVIGLMATIANNSIVLMDEPEISLHPNWQMKYIGFLNEVFKRHNSTHFVISTHSHFLVSDLKAENSTILSLQKDENKISATPIISNTYGWSSESVLYNVFKVRTTRNHFLEIDIMELVALLESKSEQTDKIEFLVDKFESLSLLKDDPLIELVSEAKRYINNDNKNR
jgi:predicted ATPase